MAIFNMHDAKTNLSDLVARAEAGEEIVIARRNLPVVKLLPLPAPDTHPAGPSAQPGFDPFEPAPDDFISKQAIAAYYRKYSQEWREMALMVGFGETGQADYEAAAIGEAVETGREWSRRALSLSSRRMPSASAASEFWRICRPRRTNSSSSRCLKPI